MLPVFTAIRRVRQSNSNITVTVAFISLLHPSIVWIVIVSLPPRWLCDARILLSRHYCYCVTLIPYSRPPCPSSPSSSDIFPLLGLSRDSLVTEFCAFRPPAISSFFHLIITDTSCCPFPPCFFSNWCITF